MVVTIDMPEWLVLVIVACCVIWAFVLAYIQSRPHTHPTSITGIDRVCHLDH